MSSDKKGSPIVGTQIAFAAKTIKEVIKQVTGGRKAN